MTVIAWIVEATWRACVDAACQHSPAGTDIVLLHVTDPDAADLAHGAYAGLLGRGHPRRDPGTRLEGLAATAAHKLLEVSAPLPASSSTMRHARCCWCGPARC